MQKRISSWSGNIEDDEMTEMERLLDSSLHPVSPRPEFVTDLQRGIAGGKFLEEEPEDRSVWHLIIVVAGLFSALLVVFVSIGMILRILSARGRFPRLGNWIKNKPVVTI